MNKRLSELYRSCRPKESLASQDQYQAANVLLGVEVEKFAELIIKECIRIDIENPDARPGIEIAQYFGVEL